MIVYRCDHCGQEVEGGKFNTFHIEYRTVSPTVKEIKCKQHEYCDKCFEKFKKYVEAFAYDMLFSKH